MYTVEPMDLRSSQTYLKFPDQTRSTPFRNAADEVAEDRNDTTGIMVDVNSVFAFPADCKSRERFLKVDIFRIAIPCESRRQVIFRVEQRGVPVSVENSANEPTVANCPSCSAARRRI